MSSECYNTPVGSLSELIMLAISAAPDFGRINSVAHNATYVFCKSDKNPNHHSVKKSTDKYELTVDLSDICKVTKNSFPARKMLVWLMIKANEQAIFNRQRKEESVTFSLYELLENGLYSTIRSARKGLESAMDVLTCIKIKGRISGYRSKEIEGLEVLFTGYHIRRNICTVYLNERVEWSFLFQRFTHLPKGYFRLSKQSSDLLYYISYLLSFKESNTKKISLRTIQRRMLLPDETTTTNNPHWSRDVKNKIARAVEEISRCTDSIELTLDTYDARDISEYLDRSVLVIKKSHILGQESGYFGAGIRTF